MPVDSRFMRKTLILPALKLGLNVIGQVRIDTALFAIPDPPDKQKRGHPEIYGDKFTQEHMAKRVNNNKDQVLHYRYLIVKARFLKGRIVKSSSANLRIRMESFRSLD